MDKFIVSARKYRPQTFDTVVGQPHITTTLKNAIRQQQLAHAFLFCGPRGVGKTTCARILAKTINCENPTPEGEACNKCQSCISFNEGGSLNYFELDAASNNSVEDIRELVNQVRFVPQSGRYKVYVIDEVHMLSQAAFNAFLKTLEEPPSYAIFILATTEKHKIIPTILSRCQIFDFKRITVQDTVEHLQEICGKEDLKADLASLQVIAQKSEGCMRDALSLLDKIASFTNGELTYSATLEHLNILDADFYFRLLEAMQKQDLSGAMLLYDEINGKGFEGDSVLNGFSEFIRNLLVCKDSKAAVLLEVVDNFREKYISVAKQTASSLLISALNILNDAEIGYRAARNKRLHVEMALIKLCYLQQALELSSDRNELSKKKVVDAARPVAFRQIRPIEIPKLSKEPANSTRSKSIREEKPAKLLIESTVALVADTNEKTVSFASQVKERKDDRVQAGKLSALGKIREQYQGVAGNGKTNLSDALEIDRLQKAWDGFVVILKESRNPGAQSFELARLRIKGQNTFEVVTSNNLEQKFIEKDRNKVFAHLQKELNNQLLQFSVLIEGRASDKPNPELSLTAREQYQKMIEEYPLVKELKDRLRLELDY